MTALPAPGDEREGGKQAVVAGPRAQLGVLVLDEPNPDPPDVDLRIDLDKMEIVGGRRALRLWLHEVYENLERSHEPAFTLVFGSELSLRAQLARLDELETLTELQRAARQQWRGFLRTFDLFREKFVGRCIRLMLSGVFDKWLDNDRERFLLAAMPLLLDPRRSPPSDDRRRCEFRGTRRMDRDYWLTEEEVAELASHLGIDPLYLETRWHPLQRLPKAWRIEKLLPYWLQAWLSFRMSDSDAEILATARDVWTLEGEFRIERRR